MLASEKFEILAMTDEAASEMMIYIGSVNLSKI